MTEPDEGRKDPSQGLNIVFTGNGKGKTSAAMGIMARACGQDLKVGVIQFIKDSRRTYGEAMTAGRLGIPFRSLGNGFVFKRPDTTQAGQAARDAWELAQQWIVSGEYEVLILDEITYLFHYRWLDVCDFIQWIKEYKPTALHLVMTGRYAPQELIEFADLVTEMKEIKHPYSERKIAAQKGVDY